MFWLITFVSVIGSHTEVLRNYIAFSKAWRIINIILQNAYQSDGMA